MPRWQDTLDGNVILKTIVMPHPIDCKRSRKDRNTRRAVAHLPEFLPQRYFDGAASDEMHCSTVSGVFWASLGGVCCRLGDDSDATEIRQMLRIDHLRHFFSAGGKKKVQRQKKGRPGHRKS